MYSFDIFLKLFVNSPTNPFRCGSLKFSNPTKNTLSKTFRRRLTLFRLFQFKFNLEIKSPLERNAKIKKTEDGSCLVSVCQQFSYSNYHIIIVFSHRVQGEEVTEEIFFLSCFFNGNTFFYIFSNRILFIFLINFRFSFKTLFLNLSSFTTSAHSSLKITSEDDF